VSDERARSESVTPGARRAAQSAEGSPHTFFVPISVGGKSKRRRVREGVIFAGE
jgi:hypothetical protein